VGLLERSTTSGELLAEALAPLVDLDLVEEVRAGPGLIAGVGLRLPAAAEVAAAAFERGLIVRALTADALTISPPLVITEAEIERLATALHDAVAHSHPLVHNGGGTT
jgi:acetylornithine/succinyldiaminopimelate/putrescine aminotransferase